MKEESGYSLSLSLSLPLSLTVLPQQPRRAKSLTTDAAATESKRRRTDRVEAATVS